MTLRQRQMAARRECILDATGALMRESGGTDFTIAEVAARADVSPATTYNLFGSKNGLLYALLNRSLDRVMSDAVQFGAAHALEFPVEAAEAAAAVYASDPVFFRELFLVLLGVRDEVHRPQFMQRCVEFWAHALAPAMQQGLLPTDECERDDLTRALVVHFSGVLELWIHGDLDEAGFKAQVGYGTALHFLGFADAAARVRLLARMKHAKQRLPVRWSFVRTAAVPARPPAAAVPMSGDVASINESEDTKS